MHVFVRMHFSARIDAWIVLMHMFVRTYLHSYACTRTHALRLYSNSISGAFMPVSVALIHVMMRIDACIDAHVLMHLFMLTCE